MAMWDVPDPSWKTHPDIYAVETAGDGYGSMFDDEDDEDE